MFRPAFNKVFSSVFASVFSNDSSPVWFYDEIVEPLAFDALTYDPSTYEMLGVKTGTGDLSAVSSSTHYAPDHEGVYQQFAANTPVYSGGRCVLTGGVGSLVDKVYANDGVGAPLPEVPYLQYYPAATNAIIQSRDFSLWAKYGTTAPVQDQVGIDGAANAAWTVDDNDAGVISGIRATIAVPVNTLPSTYVFRIGKTTGAVTFPLMGSGTATIPGQVILNTNTGLLTPRGAATPSAYESISDGDFWRVLVECTNGGIGSSSVLAIYPAATDGDHDTLDASLTGTIVLDNVDFHIGKTIAEVRGLGPIFTTTAAVATTATVYSFDDANHSDDDGVYYLEQQNSYASTEGFTFQGTLSTSASWNALFYKTNNTFALKEVTTTAIRSQAFAVGETIKVANSYHASDALMTVNVNNNYGTEVAYTTFPAGTALLIGSNGTGAFKMRNLRRYDIASYQAGKDIIDGLMT